MKWFDIQGFEGLYQINEDGQVKSLERSVRSGRSTGLRTVKEKLVATYVDKAGTKRVQLFKDNKKKILSVNALLKRLNK